MPRWLNIVLPIALTLTISFGVWASTSIYSNKQALAVQTSVNDGLQRQLVTQQSQIAVFQNILGDIKGDVKAVRAILEERARTP